VRTALTAIVVLMILSAGTSCSAYAVGDPEFRALWVDAWHAGFKSAYEVDQLIASVRANHLNAIAVQMRRRGDAYYPSSYESWAPDANPGFDALAYIIQKAHTGTPRIEVHCFFATLAVATSTPSDPNHVVNKHPEYLSKDDAGNVYDGSDYWVDPGNPEAEEYTYNVVMDVVNRYDVDGVHLDLIRYSGQHWGYNDVSVARFNTINSRSGQPAYTDATWSQWRRDQVTNLVRKIYANSIAVKPNIKVSAAVFTGDPVVTDDSNWENGQPFRVRFQDWRAWMQEGILDLVMPMDYYACGNDHYDSWICYILSRQYDRAAAVGYSATGKECWCIQEQVGKIRTPPCSVPRAHGFAQFSYWSGGTSCLGQICPSHVSIPDMPWKSAPTKGHIKGKVNYGGLWMDHATVTLTGPVSRTMYADGTGFYAFIDIPPGTYTVQASKPGYGSKQGSANVVAGQVTTKDLDLNVGGITFSNVQVTGETSTSATITWTTNIPSTSQVYYGTDRSCSSATAENTTKVTNHSVTVTNLQGQTGYYFRVVSRTDTIPLAMSSIYALVTMPVLPDIIIDDPSATFSGSWSTTTSGSGFYGTSYRWCATNQPSANKTATYTPNIPTAGNYKVSVYYPAASNRSDQVRHTVNYNGGSQTYTVNQRVNGSTWNQLAIKPFAVGTSGNLVIDNWAPGGYYVNADAVRFEYQSEAVAPSVPTGLQAQALAHDQIALTWTPSTDNVGVAGYRIHRDGAVVGFSTTASFTDADLTANKRYTYTVSAYDTSGNKSGTSTSVSKYTLSLPPTSQTITCTRQPGVWHTTNPFVFNSSGGFGAGTVSFYAFAWDNQPIHVWTGAEWVWASSTLTVNAVSGPEPYYLHLTGYNDEYVMNGSLDLGPYYFDSSAPGAPVVADDGDDTSSPTQVHAIWPASDPESGVAVYQYAVGTSPGGSDIVGWTQTSESEGTIAVPEQPVGTVLYVSAKAKNNAGLWGPVGTSDGITVGKLVESAGEAKGMADGSAIRLDSAIVTAVFTDCFYAAHGDPPGGIRVDLGSSFSIGDSVNIRGKLATVTGERQLVDAVATLAP
jgi:uncharacterized lipoprotein YddW (UPF0748 family)